MRRYFCRECIYLLVLSVAALYPASLDVQAAENLREEIHLYTYHTHPPFITGKAKGLSYDLAVYLSNKSGGRYTFTVRPMSRPRIDKMLAESRSGIIPWVNPSWFKDKAEKKYMWSEFSLMEDANAVISHRDISLVYTGPESLDSLVFGAVRGHVYAGVDDYITRTGNTRRVDAENHVDNFRKLKKKRVDVTITPKSGAEYLIVTEGLGRLLFISPQPHSTFLRKIIVVDNRQDLLDFINQTLRQMASDAQWLEIMAGYR